MKAAAAILALSAVLALAGCSRGSADPDRSTDTGTSDTDSDTESETETHTDSLPYVTDAGPWDWERLPLMEDCGPGCQRITEEPEILDYGWDVHGSLVTYSVYGGDDSYVHVVDIDTLRTLRVPDLHEDSPIEEDKAWAGCSVVYDGRLFYVYSKQDFMTVTRELVLVNLKAKTQLSFDAYSYESSVDLEGYVEPPRHLDFEGMKVVSWFGCSPYPDWNLCLFDLSDPSPGESIGEGAFLSNTIWEDTVAFLGLDTPSAEIGGYRISTGEFFHVTNDDEYQLPGRMRDGLIVYGDLRLGDSTPEGDWNHASVWAYDLYSGQTEQVTDGSAIAVYPDVFGDVIVWSDYRHCDNPHHVMNMLCAEIYGKNLATGVEFRITDLPGWAKQPPPRIWGDKVFVHMYPPSGGSALFVFDLPPEAR